MKTITKESIEKAVMRAEDKYLQCRERCKLNPSPWNHRQLIDAGKKMRKLNLELDQLLKKS